MVRIGRGPCLFDEGPSGTGLKIRKMEEAVRRKIIKNSDFEREFAFAQDRSGEAVTREGE